MRESVVFIYLLATGNAFAGNVGSTVGDAITAPVRVTAKVVTGDFKGAGRVIVRDETQKIQLLGELSKGLEQAKPKIPTAPTTYPNSHFERQQKQAEREIIDREKAERDRRKRERRRRIEEEQRLAREEAQRQQAEAERIERELRETEEELQRRQAQQEAEARRIAEERRVAEQRRLELEQRRYAGESVVETTTVTDLIDAMIHAEGQVEQEHWAAMVLVMDPHNQQATAWLIDRCGWTPDEVASLIH